MKNWKGAVLTVGGSPEPVVYSILTNEPSEVLLLASNKSLQIARQQVLPKLPSNIQHAILELEDPDDLAKLFEQVEREIPRWLEKRRLNATEVYADITGGTKPMTAALALAASTRFRRISYIGGQVRDRDELGTVQSGTETPIWSVNPWDRLAVRDLDRANWLLSRFHTESAASILHEASTKCDESFRSRIEAFAQLCEALGKADRFDLMGAYKTYRRGRERLELILENDLYRKLERLHEHWKEVAGQIKDNSVTPGSEALLEFLANADRRAEQFRYDDAVGRLYRAVELRGQQLVREAFGGELGKIRLESLKSETRKRVIEELGSRKDGHYRLGVQDLFRVLKCCDDRALSQHSGIGDSLKNHLDKRNNSLLAHGSLPVGKNDFDSLWKATLLALKIDDSEIPRWPRIHLRLP